MTTCTRCPGGGFVATKNGSKRCPECNPAPRGVQSETRGCLTFWAGSALGTIILGTVLAVAHAWASGGWG